MNYCDQVQISEKGKNDRMFCSASVNYDKSNAEKDDWNKYLQDSRPKDQTKSTITLTAKNETLQKKIKAKQEELDNLNEIETLDKQIKEKKEVMKKYEDESSCCIIL
jgi:peptidyl-tRNA hydrolase